MSDRGYRYDRDDRQDRHDRHGGGGYRDYHRRDYDSRRDYDRRGSGGGGGGYYSNRRSSGGGYDRQQQQQPQRYQSSYVGQKRRRDEPEPVDPKKQFIQRLMRLGEPGQLSESDTTSTGDTAEKTLENALWALKQEIKHNTENLEDMLLEAAVSCSHKTVHYALLLGLLHSQNPDWVADFVTAAGQRFARELAAGEVDGPRLLLRLFTCLSLTQVLHPADVLGLMARLVEVATAVPTAGADPSGLTWQPWTDQLVYAVMAALVWGGQGLAAAAPAEHTQLMESLAAYMAARPLQEHVELRPMFGASDASDAAAASDSGGASFLGQLWAALQELADPDGLNWKVLGVPHQLVEAMSAKLKGAPVELPPLELPQAPPGTEQLVDMSSLARAEVAVRLQDRYPARGGMLILERQYTDGKRPAIERFVAEELIIDLLGAFDSHRVELAQMLCTGLPLPYDYSGLLCETLFAQLLRLPAPRLTPVAFSGLIAHAALMRPAFPKYLAGSVRQLYLRLQFLAPELGLRLADVLAHFITNMNFRWPWDKYRSGLDQPPGGPQRSFLVLVLQHLVRLTSWDHAQLLQETPAEFLALLGEAPQFQGLPTAVPYPPPPEPPKPPPAAAAGDEEMVDAPVAEGAEGAGDGGAAAATDAAAAGEAEAKDAMQQDDDNDGEQSRRPMSNEGSEVPEGADAQQAMEDDAGEGAGKQQEEQQEQQQEEDAVHVWAGKLLGVIQSRPPPDRKPPTLDQVQQWITQQQMFEQLGEPEAQLRAVALAVLAAGSKSCSHCYVLLERFAPLLQQLLDVVGQSEGQAVLLGLLGTLYRQMPTRLGLALARLHELNLVSPLASVSWLASSDMLQLGAAAHEAAAADAWLLINATLDGVFARHQGAQEQQARLEAAVTKAEAKLRAASEESAAAAEAQQRADDAAEGGERDGGRGSGGRQAIVWPGAGKSGANRVELAAMREELMAKKLAEAEAAAAQQGEVMARLETERGAALLTAFKVLSRRLADAVAVVAQTVEEQCTEEQQEAAAGDGSEVPERQSASEAAAVRAESARQLCLAQMRGFARSYRSRVVQLGLTQQLLQFVEDLQLEEDVRAAVLGPLHL